MDWGLFFQAAGVGVGVLGFVIGGFWKLWAMIKDVRDEAALRAEAAQALARATRDELGQHKLHVSETYASKASQRDQTEQIMSAITGLGTQISGMNGRIDRILERPQPAARAPAPRRTTGQS